MGVIGCKGASTEHNDRRRRRGWRGGLLAAVAVMAVLAASPKAGSGVSDAGTALRMDVAELVAGAELIVEGRVASARALELADGRIETELQLSVDRTHLGADQGERRLRLPGGVLPDGRGMLIPGLPLPVPGDEVLLMLSGEGPRECRVPVGLAQGSFRLLTDATGKRLALRDQGGLQLAHSSRGRLLEADSHNVMDYAELLAEIEAALALGRRTTELPEEGR